MAWIAIRLVGVNQIADEETELDMRGPTFSYPRATWLLGMLSPHGPPPSLLQPLQRRLASYALFKSKKKSVHSQSANMKVTLLLALATAAMADIINNEASNSGTST